VNSDRFAELLGSTSTFLGEAGLTCSLGWT
jgi:hypothetical protein